MVNSKIKLNFFPFLFIASGANINVVDKHHRLPLHYAASKSWFDCTFTLVCSGKNPNLYTKERIERALERNEQVKGKIEVYSEFRAELLNQLSHVYPKLVETYKEARKDSK